MKHNNIYKLDFKSFVELLEKFYKTAVNIEDEIVEVFEMFDKVQNFVYNYNLLKLEFESFLQLIQKFKLNINKVQYKNQKKSRTSFY